MFIFTATTADSPAKTLLKVVRECGQGPIGVCPMAHPPTEQFPKTVAWENAKSPPGPLPPNSISF